VWPATLHETRRKRAAATEKDRRIWCAQLNPAETWTRYLNNLSPRPHSVQTPTCRHSVIWA